MASFTCDLPENSVNVPLIRAGSYLPIVTAGGIDVHPTAALANINVPLTVTSLSPSTGGANGGTISTIVGHGFPHVVGQLTVTLCGVNAKINTISNIAIQILTPPCANQSAENLTIAYNSLSDDTLQFTYTAPSAGPEITDISPRSASPVIKQKMTITGSGFGTDRTALRCYLSNTTHNRVYEMKVLEATDTQLIVGIPGGLPGTFLVSVSLTGFGDATIGADVNSAPANQFKYELDITSVTPKTGSYYGGTLLTIDGLNFAPTTSENMVFIGN
jgi:hypothetical protein